MTDKEKIAQLEDTLNNVLNAYGIIEEYVCLLVGNSCDENKTITYANSIVQIALNDYESL